MSDKIEAADDRTTRLRGVSDEYDKGYRAGRKTEREALSQPWAFNRDSLGRLVRLAWVRWAQTQDAPKPSWLLPYDELAEPDKEADRQIGEAVVEYMKAHVCAASALPAQGEIARVPSREEIARALYKSRGQFDDRTVEVHFDWFNDPYATQYAGPDTRLAIVHCYRDADAVLALLLALPLGREIARVREALDDPWKYFNFDNIMQEANARWAEAASLSAEAWPAALPLEARTFSYWVAHCAHANAAATLYAPQAQGWRPLLEKIVQASDALPSGHHSPHEVQKWLNEHLGPAIKDAKAALAASPPHPAPVADEEGK